MSKTLRSEESIFSEALDKRTEVRAAFLDGACGADDALRARVENLLRSHEQAGSFLRNPPAATVDDPAPQRPGTLVGPYKLLQLIGEGGMGIVYMAEQEQPIRRRVALKIVKPGMDSAQVISRFEAERQALAMMDHQNIARVLDAGTTPEGRPYFVMELVHGVPITKYCDDNKLAPCERLLLFVAVCEAIQHAHQRGIIHRDIKPSNVMVTLHDGRPVPKVIDFGVAKATEQRLTERTLFTQYGTIVGTLEYMAPEQAEMSGLGVDTRSDLYSLGVLLYELLTGTTPLERSQLREAAYDEMLRLIREEEAPRPSLRISTSGDRLATISAERNTEPAHLARLVSGELDWIVMRCLEKDRTRRYPAANALARDVERFLNDEPVEACPPTAGYKLRKFARKNRGLLTVAAAFVILLLLGVAASTWQAVRATQAEGVAVANEQQANANAAQANQQRDEAQRQRDMVQVLNDKLQAALEQVRLTNYAAQMNLAQHAWETNRIGRVTELLEHHRPKAGESDLRGFEWDYLYRLCHSDLLTLKRGNSWGGNVAFSPGKRIAGGGRGVKVWDALTGQELLNFKDVGGSVAFSPDGKRLAAFNNTFDATKKPRFGPGEVKVWDAQTGNEILSLNGHKSPINSVAFSPDSKRLASASAGGPLKVWDAQTGQELLSLKGHTGFAASVYEVAFSPDGKRLASASRDTTVKVWDAQTGQELFTCKGHTGDVTSVAFSPDGKRLASGSFDKTVKLWDAQTGQELLTFQVSTSQIYSVAFSPDGKRLASGGGAPSGPNPTVTVWDAQTGKELFSLKGHSGSYVQSVAFNPDGTRLASSTDGTIKVWDATTSPTAPTFKTNQAAALSPDGKRLAGYNLTSANSIKGAALPHIKVWDAHTGQELLSLAGHTRKVGSLAFSPDNKRVASASLDQTVKVWDAQTGQDLLTCTGHTGEVTTLAFSPDNRRLASASSDKTVKLWELASGQEYLTLKGHSDTVRSVAFSPDGTRLASAGEGEAKVWDAQTGKELLSLRGGRGVAFSPGGKRLAIISANAVTVWDAQAGQALHTFNGHSNDIGRIVFSPDGKRLATFASLDKTVKVWNAQTGDELLTLTPHGTGSKTMAFSLDGKRLINISGDGMMTIWDATPVAKER